MEIPERSDVTWHDGIENVHKAQSEMVVYSE